MCQLRVLLTEDFRQRLSTRFRKPGVVWSLVLVGCGDPAVNAGEPHHSRYSLRVLGWLKPRPRVSRGSPAAGVGTSTLRVPGRLKRDGRTTSETVLLVLRRKISRNEHCDGLIAMLFSAAIPSWLGRLDTKVLNCRRKRNFLACASVLGRFGISKLRVEEGRERGARCRNQTEAENKS
jgi:hypothetical protein